MAAVCSCRSASAALIVMQQYGSATAALIVMQWYGNTTASGVMQWYGNRTAGGRRREGATAHK